MPSQTGVESLAMKLHHGRQLQSHWTWFCLLLLPSLAGGCQACKAKNEFKDGRMPIMIEEIPQAKGADQMRLSRNGRWMALEYSLADELPLVVRLDRSAQTRPRAVRGFLGSAPADDGTFYYVEQEAPKDPLVELLRQPVEQRHSHVYKIGERRRIFSLAGAYQVWADAGKLLLLGNHDGNFEMLMGDEGGRVLARRLACSAESGYSSHVWLGERMYVLCIKPGTQATEGKDTLTVSALAANNLEMIWEQTVQAPEILYNDSELIADAQHRRLLVFSTLSREILSLRMEDGARGLQLHVPISYHLHAVPTTKVSDRIFLRWTNPERVVSGGRGWRLLEVMGDTVSILVDRPDELPPRSVLWHGGKLLLAPFGSPRFPDRDTWEQDVTRYLDLVEPGPAR